MTSDQNVQSMPSPVSPSPVAPPADGVPSGDAAEIARLRSECERLTQLLKQVEKERDDYLRVVYAWLRERFTDEDLERYDWMQEGVSFETLLKDWEQLERGQ